MARKYRNVPTVVDGIRFASKKEARRYGELKLLQKAGKIGVVTCQPSFDLIVNGRLICRYRPDFTYYQGGNPVHEDVKGVRTAIYRLKKKLMKAIYGIEIKEV